MVFMEEKQKRCKRCHGGTIHATLNPNEMKCNYCGWRDLINHLRIIFVGWYAILREYINTFSKSE